MNPRKETSSNFINEQGLIKECPMTYTYTLLGKRWKPIILWKIHEGCQYPSELLEAIPLVSRKMLYQELRELENRELIDYTAPNKRKQYHLTNKGKSLMPILQEMWHWGALHAPNHGTPPLPSTSDL